MSDAVAVIGVGVGLVCGLSAAIGGFFLYDAVEHVGVRRLRGIAGVIVCVFGSLGLLAWTFVSLPALIPY